MEEFLRKEALSGNLYDAGCTSNDCALLPPESRINWNGHKLEVLYTYLEKIGTVPQWNTYPPKCAVLIPATDSYANANKNHLHKNDSNLPICNYNSTESVLHLSKRILAPFYSFVLFEEESQDLFAKRFVRDFLHYNDEVLCGSARIVGAIEEYAVSMGFPTEFTSMHIRRGDFSIQYPEGALSAEDLLLQFEADGLSEKKLVYIATDESSWMILPLILRASTLRTMGCLINLLHRKAKSSMAHGLRLSQVISIGSVDTSLSRMALILVER